MEGQNKKYLSDKIVTFFVVLIISVFSVNPIIQYFYSAEKWGWYKIRPYYNNNILVVGIIIFAVYLLWRVIRKRPLKIFTIQKRNPALVLFILFGFWITLSTFVNRGSTIIMYGRYDEALTGTSYRKEGLMGYLSYLIYFLLAAFITDEKLKKNWLRFFAIASSFVAVLITVDYFFPSLMLETIYEGSVKGNGMSIRFFNNSNHTGYYLLVSVFVCAMMFVKSEKIYQYFLYGILTAFGSVALVIDNTLGCIIGYICASLMAVLILCLTTGKFRFKYLSPLLLFGFSVLLLMLVSPSARDMIAPNLTAVKEMGNGIYSMVTEGELDEEIVSGKAGSGRVILWKTAAGLVGQSPVLGYSADGVWTTLDALAGSDRCHNEYLNYALSFGIPAAVFYFLAVLAVYIRGLINRIRLTDTQVICLCAAFAYCVSAFFGNSMFYTAPLLFIMLGFGYYRKSD